ncbi:type II toxin-antitoxin system RelB family antitoxin [Holdemania massiliensis]|uniref:type II toxin-antitoxin system RelB family antitoxin n=1 Tax=Holdemania massiliensis TaxID=1468449 RepID=UPI001F05C89A|nr:DUF6290 family protein [Holdemania massiliensis]MCH1939223.1 DUF6290 family protein [Holdemania massiliensis]
MEFSIHMNDEERRLADRYATLHEMTLDEAFKKALFEKIEDEFDIAVTEKAYEEYVKNNKKSEPIAKLWQELNL